MKVVLFDLYDTILKDISFDFEKGLDYLYELVFHNYCSREELGNYSRSLLPLFETRRFTFEEVSFIKRALPLLCENFKVSLEMNLDDIDYKFMLQTQIVTLLNEVKEYLAFISSNNIKMYILSNTIFSTSSTKRLLDDFGIMHYFADVYCSSDYGFRKPSIQFFEYGIQNILHENTDCKIDDIVYIGNDYNTDIKGGINAGLDVIWYNIDSTENIEHLPIKIIQSFHELIG